MVQGYHIYKHLWNASTCEELSCWREAENYTDPFAVAVMKDDNHTIRAATHTCTFIPETFIGFKFHKTVHVLSTKK